MFRRRRRESADQTGSRPDGASGHRNEQDFDDPDVVLADDEPMAADEEPAGGDQEPEQGGPHQAGPWDASDEFPGSERIDFGSLQVPVSEGFEIQLNLAEDQGPLITVISGQSSLQLQAFAAPKTGGLWEDVRREIAVAVTEAGGASEEADGRFGPELRARVRSAEAGPGAGPGAVQPVRFLGVDGPRWFLRGVIAGPAAHHRSAAEPLEDVFAGIVVVRGDHPAPPRDLLEIRLPEQARQAMEEQMAEEDGSPSFPSPFERGPEITETR